MDATLKDRQGYLHDSPALIDGLRMGGVGVWRWKINTDELEWSENLEQLHKLPVGTFNGALSSFRNDVHPDDLSFVLQAIEQAVETRRPYTAVYRTAPSEAGETLWIEASGGIVVGPDGSEYLTGVCTDVTNRIRGELELSRRLQQQKAIEELGSFALAESDLDAVLGRAAQIASDVLGVSLTKILKFEGSADRLKLVAGIGWTAGLVGSATVGIDTDSQAGFTLKVGGPVIVGDLMKETRFSGPKLLRDHSVRSGMSTVIAGTGKRPFGVLGVHSRQLRNFDQPDVEFLTSIANIIANSVRHNAAEEQRNLLMREMTHRAGNMLQLVSSIASQTFTDGAVPETARQAFSERLSALANANYLIAREGWVSTRFISLLEETLKPFEEQLDLQGRDILLPPQLCFDLGLVVHELATNSVKYGALGLAGQKVALNWELTDNAEGGQTFRFVWNDPISNSAASATGSGLGTKLISMTIERKWCGKSHLEIGKGYCFSFEIPVQEAE